MRLSISALMTTGLDEKEKIPADRTEAALDIVNDTLEALETLTENDDDEDDGGDE